MNKNTLLICALSLTATTSAFASDIYAIGHLSRFVESSKTWAPIEGETCSATIRNPIQDWAAGGYQYVEMEILAEDFPKGSGLIHVNASIARWKMDRFEENLTFRSIGEQVIFAVKQTTPEKVMASQLQPVTLIIGKKSGYSEYKWRYRCDFIQPNE